MKQRKKVTFEVSKKGDSSEIRRMATSITWNEISQQKLRITVLQFAQNLLDTLEKAPDKLHMQIYKLLLAVLPLGSVMADVVKLANMYENRHLTFFTPDFSLGRKELVSSSQILFKTFATEYFYNFKGVLSALECEKLLLVLDHMNREYQKRPGVLFPYDSEELRGKLKKKGSVIKIINSF